MPLSTLANWAKEFRKWLPDMNIIVYVGTRASREVRNKTNDGHVIAFDKGVKSSSCVSIVYLILSFCWPTQHFLLSKLDRCFGFSF